MSEEKRVIDWSAIRAEYERGVTLRTLAANYGVSKSAIGKRKYQEKWTENRKSGQDTNTQEVIHPDMNASVRAHAALKLRFEYHLTWDEVATRAGFASRGAARNAVKREMDRHITHDVKELRSEELYRLEVLQARAYREAINENNEDWTWVTDRYVTLSKRKSELMNMDVQPEEENTQQNYTKKIVLTHQTSVEVPA